MADFPKFLRKDAATKSEALIAELLDCLEATTSAFIKLNIPGRVTSENFKILRDAAIGYSGGMISTLGKLLADKDQITTFTDEAKNMFNEYVDEINKTLRREFKERN